MTGLMIQKELLYLSRCYRASCSLRRKRALLKGSFKRLGCGFPCLILPFGNLWRHDVGAPELIFVMAMTVILSGRCAWQGPRK